MECPCCKHKLVKKHEGMACKNWKCELYSKLGKGWFYVSEDTTFSVPEKLNLVDRTLEPSRWIKLKQEILRRDNYTCMKCGEKQHNALKPLQVHHIIYDSQNKQLSFDEENLITVCYDCHNYIHSKDKYSFFKVGAL